MPAADPPRYGRRAVIAGLAALGTSACSRLAFLAANVPATFGPYRRDADLAYGDSPAHRLDVYRPPETAGRPPPLVVFWHGGRWTFGDKADYRFVGAALADAGLVAVLPNYRHYPQVRLAGFMQDAARAASFAALNATRLGADPARVFLMGHSAGAHMAALLALDPRHYAAAAVAAAPVAGVIGLSGPYDFLPIVEEDVREIMGPPERYPDSQPIRFVREDSPPMLLVHGLQDDTVWPKNSRNLATALEARGVEVSLRLYAGLGHADTVAALSLPARRRAPILAEIGRFVAGVRRRA